MSVIGASFVINFYCVTHSNIIMQLNNFNRLLIGGAGRQVVRYSQPVAEELAIRGLINLIGQVRSLWTQRANERCACRDALEEMRFGPRPLVVVRCE